MEGRLKKKDDQAVIHGKKMLLCKREQWDLCVKI
jgi:hypothetical protein